MAKLHFGACDVCNKQNRVISTSMWCGIETAACYECRGDSPEDYDEAGDIGDEIGRLLPKAETGEQWAHVSALESRYVALTGQQWSQP